MTNKKLRHIEILLVDDSPTDVLLTQEAFEQAKLINTLHVAEDGERAMAFLRKEGEYASAPTPDLILLDLNMPRKSGREVLVEIKSDPELKKIPVIVLTTSTTDQDILESYIQAANCYIVKPVGFENFLEAVKSIQYFWFGVVTLPKEVDDDK